jgi:hypothetical protein
MDPVRIALARHLNVDPEAVLPVHDLRVDLKLYPMDLVLIALGLERDGGSEFPMAWLDTVRTVAELSGITVAWMERGNQSLARLAAGTEEAARSAAPSRGRSR